MVHGKHHSGDCIKRHSSAQRAPPASSVIDAAHWKSHLRHRSFCKVSHASTQQLEELSHFPGASAVLRNTALSSNRRWILSIRTPLVSGSQAERRTPIRQKNPKM